MTGPIRFDLRLAGRVRHEVIGKAGPGDAGEGAGMGRVTAAAELAAELAAIPIMHPGKGAKIRISGEDPFGPPNQREPCADLIRGHPFITFAKFLGFWTPSPLVRNQG